MYLSRKICALLRTINNNSKLCLKDTLTKTIYTTTIRCAADVAFNLSDIGEGIREVVIKEWYVKVGDQVSQFDNICEVQSDKASVTITSRYDGKIKKLHYKVDDVASVGKPIVDIEIDDEIKFDGDESAAAMPPTIVNVNKEISDISEENSGIICLPSVRRLAKEHKIDLSNVLGTGKKGRVLKDDVLKYLEELNNNQINKTPQQIPARKPDERVPLTAFQRAMVKSMTQALTIPHFIYSDEIRVTKLAELRRSLRQLRECGDLKLSFMPFLVKAASNALQRFPILNATLDDTCDHVTLRTNHNIGIAMDTKAGLAVPVIKNVEQLNIVEINNELIRLMKSGKAGTFSTQDLNGATFTVSNIGVIGGTYMKPVIMPPQVAIIAFGTARLLPRFDSANNIVAEEIMNLSGAADHRIIDGATMAKFVNVFKMQVENPHLLFLNI